MPTIWRLLILAGYSCLAVSPPFASIGGKAPGLPPSHFIIARDSFFDTGPPFQYFDISIVAAEQNGTRIFRILITPPGDPCTQPAQIEFKEAVVPRSVSDLLEGKNPCSIPEGELHKERKRCKHCLTFSGADIAMRLQCGAEQRQLRMDILDRDIYNTARAKTPEQTSWTMKLMSRLDAALGPGPIEKPIFSIANPVPPPSPENPVLRELAAGRFDGLFDRSTFRLSDLYRQAMHPTPLPSVRLMSSEPMPATSELPLYPPLARAAHVAGQVRFTAKVGANGKPTLVHVVGHPLLANSVVSTISAWTYSNTPLGTPITGVIEFANSCALQNEP